jgi:hypothetical protein
LSNAWKLLSEDMELFNLFSEAFRNLPLAHLVDNKAATGMGMNHTGRIQDLLTKMG